MGRVRLREFAPLGSMMTKSKRTPYLAPTKQVGMNRLLCPSDFLVKSQDLTPSPSRNKAMRSAAEEFGYRQKEIADHLGMHYSTVSRLINEEMSK